MRKLLSTFVVNGFFLMFIIASLHAQTGVDSTRNMSGGFGHFFVGPAFFKTPGITSYLKKSDVLGLDYSPSGIAYSVGGEGGAMIERVFIGGGGFGVISPAATTDIGSAAVSVGGGYFKAGYKFWSKKRAFMFVYTSFGGAGYNIELSNLSDSVSLNFNHKSPVAPSEKKTYTVSGFLFDFGVSLKTLPLISMSEKRREIGGFMLGLDAGVRLVLPLSKWTNGENVVTGPPDLSGMACPYLQLTIGGGGFGTRKK